MATKRISEEVTTKTGVLLKENYCRKCMKNLPVKDFYECADGGFVDANGLMSVCKKCIQDMYDTIFDDTQSLEKTIHKLCTSLNIKYSNDAVSATRAHIDTLLENGKKAHAIFSIYKMKLTATKKSMDKSGLEDMSYEDTGTIYLGTPIVPDEIPIPSDVVAFWGKDLDKKDIEYLETNYAKFKQTHKADTYAEIILLKQVCYTLLDIENKRRAGDDTTKVMRELQDLMKNLAISPNIANAVSANKGIESIGLWIQDLEMYEPGQWLLSDPKGDMYRDVGDVIGFFNNYIVRPIKNFIMGSKDFNVEDEDIDVDFFDDESDEAETLAIIEKQLHEGGNQNG